MTSGVRFVWTPERHHLAVVMRDQGLSFEEIAAHLGTSKTTVHTYFQKRGLDTTPRRKRKTDLNNAELNDIERRLEAREPSRLIAASYGMSRTSLSAVLKKHPSLKMKQRAPGAPRANAEEEEMTNLERYSKFNLPINVIAFAIKRSPTFLREKLAADDDNPWKTAYMQGRMDSHMKTGLLMEKSLDMAFDSEKEISPGVVQVLKHWDNRMNGVGEKVQATFDTEGGAPNELKIAERAMWISDRQMQLITAGKIDQNALLSKEKMEILAHAKELEKIPEAEWWDHVRQ